MNKISRSKFMRSWTLDYIHVALDSFSKGSPRPFVILPDPRINKEYARDWMVLEKEIAIIQTHLNEAMGLSWEKLVLNGYDLEEDCLASISVVQFVHGVDLWVHTENQNKELRIFLREMTRYLSSR